jgi:hypothetical protein
VLVKSLYMVLASAIGLWFVKMVGFAFLYSSTIRLVFQLLGICCCL